MHVSLLPIVVTLISDIILSWWIMGSYREYIRQDFCRPDESLYVVGSREGRSNGKKMETGEKRYLRREKTARIYKDLKQADVRKVQHGLKVK